MLLLVLLPTAGCVQTSRQPQELVILVDTSASITEEARKQEFDAVEWVLDHLQRGDSLALIPITGDAESESQGKVVRVHIDDASHRQAYDQDIRQTVTTAKRQLEELRSLALSSPFAKTDLLGTLRVASEEFSQSQVVEKRLIILSDFIEDDRQINFRTSPALASPDRARLLASQESRMCVPRLARIPVYLGLLQSRDYAITPPLRREAIHTFWRSCVEAYQAKPSLHIDGAASLSHWLDATSTAEGVNARP